MESANNNEGDPSVLCKGLSVSEKMKLSSLTYKILEELRMRREQDAENEKKIQKLLHEKFIMGWNLEQKVGQMNNNEERHEVELRELRRHMEDKNRQAQLEASQQHTHRKMAEKEKEAFKEEIRKLQLTNYGLEKKLRELESSQRTLSSDREQHMAHLAKFEIQCRELETLVTMVTEKQGQLEGHMCKVRELNQRLLYQSCHQKCVLEMKEAEIVQLKVRLHDNLAHNKLEPRVQADRERGLQAEIDRLTGTVQKMEDHLDSLVKEKDDWKEKYWVSLKQLEEAHTLVNVHLHNAAQYRDEVQQLERTQKDTQVKLSETETTLANISKQLREEQAKKEQDGVLWKQKEETLDKTAQELATQQQTSEAHTINLESDVTALKVEIETLTGKLDEALAVLNVERCPREVQTDTSMMLMTQSEVQAVPDTYTTAIQCSVEMTTSVTQTINPALANNTMQTEALPTPTLATMETQTGSAQVRSRQIQTDPLKPLKIPEVGLADRKLGEEKSNASAENYNNAMNLQGDGSKCTTKAHAPTIETLHDVIGASIEEDIRDLGDSNIMDRMITLCPLNSKIDKTETERSIAQKFDVKESLHHTDCLQDVYEQNAKAEVLDENRVQSLLASKEEFNRIHQEDNLQTENIARDKCDTASQSVEQDIGLSVPRINVDEVIAKMHTEIDPGEFEVKLTQDADNMAEVTQSIHSVEKCTDTPCEKGDADKGMKVELQNTLVNNSSERISGTLKRAKSLKHKLLTKDFVANQFNNFDVTKEEFDHYQYKPATDCSITKQIKLSSASDCSPEEQILDQDPSNEETRVAKDCFRQMGNNNISGDMSGHYSLGTEMNRKCGYREPNIKKGLKQIQMSSSERLLFNVMHGDSPAEFEADTYPTENLNVHEEPLEADNDVNIGDVYISESSDPDSSPIIQISDDQEEAEYLEAELSKLSNITAEVRGEVNVTYKETGDSEDLTNTTEHMQKTDVHLPKTTSVKISQAEELVPWKLPSKDAYRVSCLPNTMALQENQNVSVHGTAVSTVLDVATTAQKSAAAPPVTGEQKASSSHILQAYRDIVSRITPVQLSNQQSAAAASSATTRRVSSAHTAAGQHKSKKSSSPVMPNPRSILKGVLPRAETIRSKSVSWNKFVNQTN